MGQGADGTRLPDEIRHEKLVQSLRNLRTQDDAERENRRRLANAFADAIREASNSNNSNHSNSVSLNEHARQAYESLCFDFPLVHTSHLSALAETCKNSFNEERFPFPLTQRFVSGVCHVAKQGSSNSAPSIPLSQNSTSILSMDENQSRMKHIQEIMAYITVKLPSMWIAKALHDDGSSMSSSLSSFHPLDHDPTFEMDVDVESNEKQKENDMDGKEIEEEKDKNDNEKEESETNEEKKEKKEEQEEEEKEEVEENELEKKIDVINITHFSSSPLSSLSLSTPNLNSCNEEVMSSNDDFDDDSSDWEPLDDYQSNFSNNNDNNNNNNSNSNNHHHSHSHPLPSSLDSPPRGDASLASLELFGTARWQHLLSKLSDLVSNAQHEHLCIPNVWSGFKVADCIVSSLHALIQLSKSKPIGEGEKQVERIMEVYMRLLSQHLLTCPINRETGTEDDISSVLLKLADGKSTAFNFDFYSNSDLITAVGFKLNQVKESQVLAIGILHTICKRFEDDVAGHGIHGSDAFDVDIRMGKGDGKTKKEEKGVMGGEDNKSWWKTTSRVQMIQNEIWKCVLNFFPFLESYYVQLISNVKENADWIRKFEQLNFIFIFYLKRFSKCHRMDKPLLESGIFRAAVNFFSQTKKKIALPNLYAFMLLSLVSSSHLSSFAFSIPSFSCSISFFKNQSKQSMISERRERDERKDKTMAPFFLLFPLLSNSPPMAVHYSNQKIKQKMNNNNNNNNNESNDDDMHGEDYLISFIHSIVDRSKHHLEETEMFIENILVLENTLILLDDMVRLSSRSSSCSWRKSDRMDATLSACRSAFNDLICHMAAQDSPKEKGAAEDEDSLNSSLSNEDDDFDSKNLKKAGDEFEIGGSKEGQICNSKNLYGLVSQKLEEKLPKLLSLIQSILCVSINVDRRMKKD